jgi:hypothetical protein
MAEIISMKKRNRIDYDWGLQLVLKKRKALLHSVPIMSKELTEIDKWLATQSGLPLKVLLDVWQRAMFCSWVFYGDAHPELKHIMLLQLRDHYRDFQKLPPRLQTRMWPMWERFRQEFLDEEMEQANAQ